MNDAGVDRSTKRNVAKERLRRWLHDPVLFVNEVFEGYWSHTGHSVQAWQRDALTALTTENQIALQACKGPGKTAFEGWAALWFSLLHPESKIACTAITGDNLKDNLWTELNTWINRNPLLASLFDWRSERISVRGAAERWWISARTWSRNASPEQQAETLAGLHARFVMAIIDEAGGVPDAVANTAEAIHSAADKSIVIVAGNPTRLEGPLYRAATTERDKWWRKVVTGDPDDPERSPLVSVEWAADRIKRYGRDSNIVRIDVLGIFPRGTSDAICDLGDLEICTGRTDGLVRGRKVLGVDVARFGGDWSAVAVRDGDFLDRIERWQKRKTTYTAGRVHELAMAEQAEEVRIDDVGVGGGVTDILSDKPTIEDDPVNGRCYEVIPVNVGEGAYEDPTRYSNLRAELTMQVADIVAEHGMSIDPAVASEGSLIREASTIRYGYSDTQKIKIESKERYKARFAASPDSWDAVVLAFARCEKPEPAMLRVIRKRALKAKSKRGGRSDAGTATTA